MTSQPSLSWIRLLLLAELPPAPSACGNALLGGVTWISSRLLDPPRPLESKAPALDVQIVWLDGVGAGGHGR